MIERYSLPEMAGIWSEANKLAVWKEVDTLEIGRASGWERV